MLLEKLIDNLPKEKKKIQVQGLATNSKKVKKGFIFFKLTAINLMEKIILTMPLKKELTW